MSFSARGRWSTFLGTTSLALLVLHCTGDNPVLVSPATPDGGEVNQPDAAGTDGATGIDAGVALLDKAVTVTVGAEHSCALLQGGDIVCWGDNSKGQLGVPSASKPSSSIPVKVPLGEAALGVTAGTSHNCAVTARHTVKCWGDNASGQTGSPQLTDAGFAEVRFADGGAVMSNIAAVNAGARHGCARALPTDGGLQPPFDSFTRGYCWGSNLSYELGQTAPYGPNANRPTAAAPLEPGLDDTAFMDSFYAASLAGGRDFGCARVAHLLPGSGVGAASIACWGANDFGQVGREGGSAQFARPQILIAPDGGGALGGTDLLVAGARHGCSVTAYNALPVVACWGANDKGQIADATSAAFLKGVGFLKAGLDVSKVTAIAAGGDVTCVVADQQAKCVGANDQGQLGLGTVNTIANAAWATVTALSRASAISVGGTHVCAVLGGAAGSPGPVSCWGKNTNGQLGDGLNLAVGYPEADRKYLRAAPVAVRAAQ